MTHGELHRLWTTLKGHRARVIIGEVPESPGQPSESEVRSALGPILAAEQFAKSPRLQRFLSYVVEKALAGQAHEIKEYNVGVEVYGRDPSFDPRTDTIVRVEARRLRQQLAAYYASEGKDERVRVEIPRGGYAPRFVVRESVPAPQVPRRIFAFRSLLLIAAFSVAVAGSLAAWWGLGLRSRRVPSAWRHVGGALEILDQRGRLCWSVPLAPAPADVTGSGPDKVLIADLDEDGRVEVLVNVMPTDPVRSGGLLKCYEHNGKLRWTRRFGRAVTFGDRHFEATYRGERLCKVQDAGRRPGLLVVANHTIWYPSWAALLDPGGGSVVEEYWHPGALRRCLLQDLDGDGVQEVLLGGINNPGLGLGHAALAVLKIPFSAARGRQPADSLKLPPITGGGELDYLLFPLPAVSKVMGVLPQMGRLALHGDRRLLISTPLPEGGAVIYLLDFNLRVIEYRPSDDFVALHERYYRQGLLERPSVQSELENLGRVLRFAAAPDANSPEVAALWGPGRANAVSTAGRQAENHGSGRGTGQPD